MHAQIPLDELSRYLSAHVDGIGALRAIKQFDAGQSNPTYLLMTDSGRYVLRKKPPGNLLKSAHAIDREFRVLQALRLTDVPVPAPIHFCADETVIGTPFYLMAFVDGRVFWDPRLPEVGCDQRERMYGELNRVLSALHAIDPVAAGLADFTRMGGYFERQIRRWTAQYRAAETERRPDMEQLIDWLPRSIPGGQQQVSLVHGDFRLDNVMFDVDGRAVAILDWELSSLGPPCADLAYQCAQWRLPVGPMRGLRGVDREALKIPSEDAYVEQYCGRMGWTGVGHWTFHLVLSLFRLAAICQGVYMRGLAGNALNGAALEFGERTRVIAATAVGILCP